VNTTTYTFIIPGPPQGKARPRMGKGGHVYTPQQTRDYEAYIRECWALHSKHEPLTGAIKLKVYAYFPIPPSWPKKKKQAALDGEIFPTGKPDGDNILKAVCDALNGCAWVDDARVVSTRGSKEFAPDDEPCLIVQYQEIGMSASDF
jgi:Holliday junction resolvase RusA-like endonuclease